MRVASPAGPAVRRCLATVVALLWCCGAATQSVAQKPLSAEAIQKLRATKAAEDWTLEERLAVRFDLNDARRRRDAAREDEASMLAPGERLQASPEDLVVVDGSKNPELALPSELFVNFLNMGYAADPTKRAMLRADIEAKARAIGFDRSPWKELEVIAADVLRVNQEVKARAKRLLDASPEEKQKGMTEVDTKHYCRDRWLALRAAQDAFGAARFNRLLYTAVAPGFRTATRGQEWKDQLGIIEKGCQ